MGKPEGQKADQEAAQNIGEQGGGEVAPWGGKGERKSKEDPGQSSQTAAGSNVQCGLDGFRHKEWIV